MRFFVFLERHLRAHGFAGPRWQKGNGRRFRRKLSEKLSDRREGDDVSELRLCAATA